MQSIDSSPTSKIKFAQTNPRRTCPHHDPRCKSWTCSIECYKRLAWKESKIQLQTLHHLPDNTRIYFGTLAVSADLSEVQVQQCRTNFLDNMRAYCKRLKIKVCQLRAITEIGQESFRHHHHYVMYASGAIEQDQIRELWAASVPEGVQVRVSHRRPYKSIEAATAYMYKFGKHSKIMLPSKGGIDVTWGSRGFYGPGGKKARWDEVKVAMFGGPSDHDFFEEEKDHHVNGYLERNDLDPDLEIMLATGCLPDALGDDHQHAVGPKDTLCGGAVGTPHYVPEGARPIQAELPELSVWGVTEETSSWRVTL